MYGDEEIQKDASVDYADRRTRGGSRRIAHGTMGPENQLPETPSTILNHVELLQVEASHLDDLCNRFEKKLSGVTRPSMASDDNDPSDRMPVSSRLADDLSGVAAHLRSTARRFQELLENIDL